MALYNRTIEESLKSNPLYLNDFDVAFAQPLSPLTTVHVSPAARPWLDLWVTQNPHHHPSKEEVQSLVVLTGTREERVTAWMKQSIRLPSPPTPPDTEAEGSIHIAQAYRPKCLASRWRYRYRGPRQEEDSAKIFECTHSCGQSFPRQRKGDWARHERVNFEEWICPVPACRAVLSRREKLRDHLRDFHGSCHVAVQEAHRRVTLHAVQRPCGFCQRRCESWAEWLAHVGAHFEGLLSPGGRKTMADWKQQHDGGTTVDVGVGVGVDVDMGDADSMNYCMSELSASVTTTTTDSGFFSYEAASVLGNEYSNSSSRPHSGLSSSVTRRIAPPILGNPRPDVYNAPDPTAGQPYAFPDPDNQWSLQTVRSLLSCWPEETGVASHGIGERVGLS